MSISAKGLDAAFQGAGQKLGMEIWRIEDFKPVPLAKSDYGKFYSGDSYIVLQTTSGKSGAYIYDIHFWLGKDTSQDEAGTAAIKTVELDGVLGGRAVQHREIQSHESDKFLSYFKPCLIPLEGGFASGFKTHEDEGFKVRLYTCSGKHAIRMQEVPFARSSLNHDDIFILDTEKKIYQFNGANSSIQERAKALEVLQYLKDKYHHGTCEVAVVDDGKFVAETESGDFWAFFGGFAPIGKKPAVDEEVLTAPKFYSIKDGQLKLVEAVLTKATLDSHKCYLVDCGAEMYVWVGRFTPIEERKSAMKLANELITSQNRPKATRITQMVQGHEANAFKTKFESWPVSTGMTPTTTSGGEEGRGIVAARLRQQGIEPKVPIKSSGPLSEDVPTLLEENGKLEVWIINDSAKTPLPKEEIGKFYSGDCYIVLYSYHSSDKKEEYYLCCWIGKYSTQEDQSAAARLANGIWNSLRGRPVQGLVHQGVEPPQFVALFQPMIVLKGGVSAGYKKSLSEKSLNDDTYVADAVALIQVSGTSPRYHKAYQVDAVATSLCSTDCFILQSGSGLVVWNGNLSSPDLHQSALKVAELLKPGVAVKNAKEGGETSSFWYTLGGKKAYAGRNAMDATRDPHLYTFSLKNEKIEVTEVFSFTQDDLFTEDILILDTRTEVFIWIGSNADSKEKTRAFDIGQKYIDRAVLFEGLSPDVPLYKVTEGNEPGFFKICFSWDNMRSVAQGNSYHKKLSIFGMSAPESPLSQSRHGGHRDHYDSGTTAGESSKGSGNGAPTQKASALAALSSALNPTAPEKTHADTKSQSSSDGGPTQRAAAMAALTSALNPTSSNDRSQHKNERVKSSGDSGQTQRAAAVAALSNAFNQSSIPKPPPAPVRSGQGSQKAAAVAALSSVLTAEQAGSSGAHGYRKSDPAPENTTTDAVETTNSEAVDVPTESEAVDATEQPAEKESVAADVPDQPAKQTLDVPEQPAKEIIDVPERSSGKDIVQNEVATPAVVTVDVLQEQAADDTGEETFSYERLKATSANPVRGINTKQREAYLSAAEFQTIFRMTKEAFYQQPKWKQDLQKRKNDLF